MEEAVIRQETIDYQKTGSLDVLSKDDNKIIVSVFSNVNIRWFY